ncbi:MAG: hypothetical protein IJ688_03270 [Treponema sp.]|nr:hypothetical protein [Treponema sp.]
MEWERQRVYDYEDGKAAGIAQGMERGIKQGIQTKAIDTAKNLLKMNILSPQQIAQATNLSLEAVLELQKEITGCRT